MPLRVKYICAHCGKGIYGEFSIRPMAHGVVLRYHRDAKRDCKVEALLKERAERRHHEEVDETVGRGEE